MSRLKLGGSPHGSRRWINENHPENGVFRAYWKDIIDQDVGATTLNPDEGESLRYEWYYKDGKRADGVSKSWYPNGQLKQSYSWKNGKKEGKWNSYYSNGAKKYEFDFKNGKKNGLVTQWYESGQKEYEKTYKDHKLNGLSTWWYKNGQKSGEVIYKGDVEYGKWTKWDPTGLERKIN